MDKALRAERLRVLSASAAAAKQVATHKIEERNREIEQADLEGWGVREIARTTGLSHGQVDRVVADRTAQRQQRALEAAQLA